MKSPSINLSGTKGDTLQITVETYSYPKTTDDHDGNYLTVSIRAQNEDGSWEGSSPCLFTWEVKWFSKWLKHVVRGEMEDESLAVMDQDFGLKYLDYSKGFHCFVAILKYNLANPSYGLNEPPEAVASIVYLSLTENEVDSFIRFFDNVFIEFPPRGSFGKMSLEKLPGPRLI